MNEEIPSTMEPDEDDEGRICKRCRTEMSVTGTYLHWHCDVCGNTEKIEREEP